MIVDSDKIKVTKNIYDKVQEGDKVYVLKDDTDDARQIYLLDEYRYVGDRLKERES